MDQVWELHMRVVTPKQQSDSLFSTGEQVMTNTRELTVKDICMHAFTLYMHINNGDETRALQVLQPSGLNLTGLRRLLRLYMTGFWICSVAGVTSDPNMPKANLGARRDCWCSAGEDS